MDKSIFENELLSVIQTWSYPISPGCENNLRSLINKAINEIDTRGLLTDISSIEKTKDNLRLILSTTTSIAKSQGHSELHDFTLRSALNKLCPIFPFC